MRKMMRLSLAFVLVAVLSLTAALPVQAQDGANPQLILSTDYPAQTIGLGEKVTLRLELEAVSEPQVVRLEMAALPDGWSATFRGGGREISAVYVKPGQVSRVDLELQPDENVSAGQTYDFVVQASSDLSTATLPVSLTIKEKAPSRLTLTANLPVLKGSPETTFRYSLNLKNEGDEDLNVDLQALAPDVFLVTFKVAGQEVTSLPVEAGRSKTISVEARPLGKLTAGQYPLRVLASAGDVQTSIDLAAEVAGRASLDVTGLDGRLSDEATAGKQTSLKLVVRNTGSAEARGITLSATTPNGWEATFEPAEITTLGAGETAEVTLNLSVPKDTIAGDYIVTVRADSAEKVNTSANFRITVTTSTLWGVVGIALIALALAMVMLAVARFGRR